MEKLEVLKGTSIIRTLIFLSMLGLVFSLHAQQRVVVPEATGEWVISDDITPTIAREKALGQAKSDALRKAGVPEKIFESRLKFDSETARGGQSLFESVTGQEISGELSEWSIIKEEKQVNTFHNLVYVVKIKATVVIYQELRDQSFDFTVNGVRESYLSPDKLTFGIKPWKGGYLKAFVISENECEQLFPVSGDPLEPLTADSLYTFPLSKKTEFEVTTTHASEVNYLLLLLTKKNIPIETGLTGASVVRYVSNIHPSEKCLKVFALLIKNP